jgi:hypothetical protein
VTRRRIRACSGEEMLWSGDGHKCNTIEDYEDM